MSFEGRAAVVWLCDRVRNDLQFSRIFLVDLAATAAYCATTALLLALHAATAQSLPPLAFAAMGYAVSLGVKVALVVYLERRGGDARQFVGSERLVTSGPYAVSRNPVYVLALAQSFFWSLGLLALGLAAGGACAGLAALAAPTLLYGHYWGMDALVIPYEEMALRAKHPDAFAAYCARVHRWFGRR